MEFKSLRLRQKIADGRQFLRIFADERPARPVLRASGCTWLLGSRRCRSKVTQADRDRCERVEAIRSEPFAGPQPFGYTVSRLGIRSPLQMANEVA